MKPALMLMMQMMAMRMMMMMMMMRTLCTYMSVHCVTYTHICMHAHLTDIHMCTYAMP